MAGAVSIIAYVPAIVNSKQNICTHIFPNLYTLFNLVSRHAVCKCIQLHQLPDVHVGDAVELFGCRQRVDSLAAALGTIPYELTCAVSKRVPRLYLENDEVVERSLRILL